MLDAAFRFLFKYPLLVFRQGDFVMGVSRPIVLALLVAAAIAAAALITYRSISSEGPSRDKAVLIGLRLALVAVLLFCLIRPTLVLKAAVPQQNFLGVLVDDSRSMLIADRDGQPRSEFVHQQLAGKDSTLLVVGQPDGLGLGAQVRRHVDAARNRARAGARRVVGPAAGRARHDQRRR